MPVIAVARHAMNTRFEVVLHGENPVALRAAADQALEEIERLEGQLTVFRPTSEISRVNRSASGEPVRVSPPVFHLLERARQLSLATGGAFDPTVGPLLEAWGFVGGRGRMATPEAVAEARTCVGMEGVELNEVSFTVRFTRAGMSLDLGAIGKGYALDCAAEILREAGVVSGFLHGGTSSSLAIGRPGDADAWVVAVEDPRGKPEQPRPPLAKWRLEDESLGVSGIHGKAFHAGNRVFGHVLDPRTGQPVQGSWMAAVASASAADSDALSTALITLGVEGLSWLPARYPQGRFLVLEAPDENGAAPVHVVGTAGVR
ncbi:MAG: FAD:protein FMN transferase [Limisphaerales bacterium]